MTGSIAPNKLKRKKREVKTEMNTSRVVYSLRDNGGRRAGIERRHFSYSDHIPERRDGAERRTRFDRRDGEERRCKLDRRKSERYSDLVKYSFNTGRKSLAERRQNTDRRDFMIL